MNEIITEEFRIKKLEAYEPGFWENATTWVKFKDAVIQLEDAK